MKLRLSNPMRLWVTILLAAGVLRAQAPEQSTQKQYYAGSPELERFIEEALVRNPSIKQGFSRYQSSLARIPQAGALPDPVLGFLQYIRTPETRVGAQTTAVSFSQRFPWFGKLGDREGIAAKEAGVVGESYEARKDEVVRQVKTAYFNLAYVDRALAIAREDLTLLEHYETLAEARYRQGIGLQQAVIKLQAEITRDRNRLDGLQSRRVDAVAAMNALLDRPPATAIPTVELSPRSEVTVNYDALYARGRDNRPEIRAALLEIERDEKKIQLAHKDFWPDFTVGAGFVNVDAITGPALPPEQNGKNIYSVSVGLNLPIRRRKYDAAVVEATESKIASREGYRSAVNDLQSAVRATGFRIQTLNEQIALFEHTLIPQAEQALSSSEAAYSTGEVGVLDLLDSERVLLSVRLGLAELDSEYRKSLADMERIIGAPFPEVRP